MNREIYPGSIYPLMGDVVSTAGVNKVTVAALRNITLDFTTPDDGAAIVYDADSGQFKARVTSSVAIMVNSEASSDDYIVSVNVARPIKVNGV
jgi:hypothetical protein